MKKTLFAIGAMVAMVACSNDFVVKEAAQEAIGFDNAFVDNSTRSVVDPSLHAGNLTNFQVFGYVEGAPLFDQANNGVTVIGEGVGDDASWTYEGTKYWIKDANYNFNAVAPYTNGNWAKSTDNTATTATKTTLSFDNNGTTDLLYATATAVGMEAGENDPVAFTFRHTLSKVKFSFENAYNASNTTIRVKDIKITDAYAKGSVVLDADTDWTPVADSNNLTLDFGMATDDQATTSVKENDVNVAFAYGKTYESQNELFMIPGAGATEYDNTDPTKKGYTITFTVELLVSGQDINQDDDYEHTIYTNFIPEPGKSYDLKAVINHTNIDPETSQDPIEFTVTKINDWVEADADGDADTNTDTELN